MHQIKYKYFKYHSGYYVNKESWNGVNENQLAELVQTNYCFEVFLDQTVEYTIDTLEIWDAITPIMTSL